MKILIRAKSVCHDFCIVPFRFFRSFSAVWSCSFRKLHSHHHAFLVQASVCSLTSFRKLHSARSQTLAFSEKTALHAKIAPNLSSAATYRKSVQVDSLVSPSFENCVDLQTLRFFKNNVVYFLRINTKTNIFAFWIFKVSNMAKQFHTAVTTEPAPNEQFATSGGVGSYDTLYGTASSGSRPSLCETPACGKLPPRWAQADKRGGESREYLSVYDNAKAEKPIAGRVEA